MIVRLSKLDKYIFSKIASSLIRSIISKIFLCRNLTMTILNSVRFLENILPRKKKIKNYSNHNILHNFVYFEKEGLNNADLQIIIILIKKNCKEYLQ